MVKLIIKYWKLINIVFILLLCLYQLNKLLYKGNDVMGGGISFNTSYISIILFFISIVGYLIATYRNINFTAFLIIISLSYSITVFGFIIQKDPNLSWHGLDVPTYNYELAKETKDKGAYFVINTWNARANPYNKYSDTLQQNSDTRKFIDKYNLNWIIGDRWDNVTKEFNLNNRPVMHPPTAPVLMGFWLFILPFGRYSVQLLMILINLFVFGLLIYKYRLNFNESFSKIIIISVITSPAFILFIEPSADQIGMLFFISSLILLLKLKRQFFINYIAGILIAFSFYSKFLFIFYIIAQSILFLILYKRASLRLFLGYISGVFSVIILFSIMGYYPWLTFLTGKASSELYVAFFQKSALSILLDFLYFGLPIILLISIYFFDNFRISKFSIEKNNLIIFMPLIIGSIIYIFYQWKVGTFARYLNFSIIAFAIIFSEKLQSMGFKKSDIVISIVSNYAFLCLTIYF